MAVKSFVSPHPAATLLPSGHTQALRRTTRDTVTLPIQDPFWALLLRHVITMIQDETTITVSRCRVTTQAVTKETGLRLGRKGYPLIGDRGRINPSSRAIILTTRHVIRGNIKTVEAIVHQPGSVFLLAQLPLYELCKNEFNNWVMRL